MTHSLAISVQTARRLALAAQGLDGASSPNRDADEDDIERLVRRITYVQLDPISVVARSPLLVLWARLGPFDDLVLDSCLYKRRSLFEYWAHAAAILPTSDLDLLRWKMVRYPFHDRVRDWMGENRLMGEAILAQLAAEGPLPAQAFAVKAKVSWDSSGWTGGRDIDRMLTFLWRQGKIVVAGRVGGKRIWQLASEWFAAGGNDDQDEAPEVVRRTLARSLTALGVGTRQQASASFGGLSMQEELAAVFASMVADGEVVRVSVEDNSGRSLKGDWLVHRDRLEAIEWIEAGEWEGRSVLLSPFDNLIIDRTRTEALFGFDHRMEIYVPAPKRRWGYYVLPYLHGDRFAGRLDIRVDRKADRLDVLAVHAEPWAARPPGGLRPLRGAINELATCCGVGSVGFEPGALAGVPAGWAKTLV